MMPCSSLHPSKLVRQSPPSCNNPLYNTGSRIPWDAPDFAPTQRIDFRRDGSARGRVVCEGGAAWVCMEGAEVDRSARSTRTSACPQTLGSKTPCYTSSIPDPSPVLDSTHYYEFPPRYETHTSQIASQSTGLRGTPNIGSRRRIDFRGARAVARTMRGLSWPREEV